LKLFSVFSTSGISLRDVVKGVAEDIQYPQFSAEGLPLTYVPDSQKADGKPVDSQWKVPVRVATNSFATLSGLQTVNGVSVMEGDRVLVKDQMDPSENGIWIASALDWYRAPDMRFWPQFVSAVVAVEENTVAGEEVWVTSVASDGIVGVTQVYWIPVTAATGTIPTFTPLRALVTNVVGEPAASPTTATEIAFVSGVTSAIQAQFATLDNEATSAFSIAVQGTNAAATAQSTANAAYTLAEAGTDIGSLAYTIATSIGDKYVRTTRFASIGAGTGGAVVLPPNAVVVLDDFGGAIDAVVTTINTGRPTFTHAFTVTGAVVTTSFDAAGNYSFSGAPSAYPVALVYRVRQRLSEFDSTSADIIGDYDLEGLDSLYAASATAGTIAANPSVVILADCSAGSVVVSLPVSSASSNYHCYVKKVDSTGAYVYVRPAGGTLDGDTEKFFNVQYTTMHVFSNGTNWFIL
jgi:hypothetical protein